ncbi:hypothetical protein JAAARDRAFT_30983 [Jaapia argillacea MUCL 33604]|uniref:Cysteine-rich PDZ-binding protein n=1 Tax=Jaapia argillacea MUCL 33604 TaxID=933084 RepID=A0A067Q3I9_9AGAM|nr:hypothetical protein JAAARDRAFT_30983 [Jaapia argillacea MUCL 33604]
MVCKKCEKKLSKVAAPDPFQSTSTSIKEGSRKVGSSSSSTTTATSSGGSGFGKPKLGSRHRYQPYKNSCKDCKQPTTQNGAKYCHGCAYKKGLCSICGKQILDTTGYVMSSK